MAVRKDLPRSPDHLSWFVWSQIHKEEELLKVACLEANQLLYPLLPALFSRTCAVTEPDIGAK